MSLHQLERINRRGSLEPRDPGAPRRSLVVALVLGCVSLMTLDHLGGPDGSPIEPLRWVAGEVFGPVEAATEQVLAPVWTGPGWLRSRQSLRDQVDQLEADNAALRHRLATDPYDRNRLEEYDGLTAAATQVGYALVPARVVAMGPAQTFSRTVTIDAGSDAGVRPDETVLNAEGLVGRVVRVTSSTATVLLVVDRDSVVGGRVGESLKVGFLHGRGALGDPARLDLDLVDQSFVPARGDTVVTWGSKNGAPYVTGVPIGTVTSVVESLRDGTRHAVIRPAVDFGALDVVGVVVPDGGAHDRAVVEPDGTLQ